MPTIEMTEIIGLDEAGRGPLAGPVVAAAVHGLHQLPKSYLIQLDDSKNLKPQKRQELALVIKQHCQFGLGLANVTEITQYNILNASHLAMTRALIQLGQFFSANNYYSQSNNRRLMILVDGKIQPKFSRYAELPKLLNNLPIRAVVKGDGLYATIAAASILAKVTRDDHMLALSQTYPQYQFARHKGYGTKLHCQLIREFGICPEHRQSFLQKIY